MKGRLGGLTEESEALARNTAGKGASPIGAGVTSLPLMGTVEGVSIEQMLFFLEKNKALMPNQKRSITLELQDNTDSDKMMISVLDHSSTTEEVEAEPSAEFLSRMRELEAKKAELLQQLKDAQAKRARDEAETKRRQDEEDERRQREEAETKAAEDAAIALVKKKHVAPAQLRNLDGFLKRDVVTHPLMNIDKKIDKPERAAHAHTLNAMVEYLRSAASDPSKPYTGKVDLAQYKDKMDVTKKTNAELQAILGDYQAKIQEELNAMRRPKKTALAGVKPIPDKTMDDHIDALRRALEQNQQEIERLKNAQPATTMKEAMKQRKIATVEHQGRSMMIRIPHPDDTRKVLETFKGVKGEARIHNPNLSSPEAAKPALQMVLHSIVVLDLVPELVSPIPLTLYNEPAKLEEFCKNLKEEIDKNHSENPVSSEEKGRVQQAFNEFLDKNKMPLDLKYTTAKEPRPGPP